jgi:Ser/Thr protein kinase RdoA (MazF antagonist)
MIMPPDVANLWVNWPLKGPWCLRNMPGGSNNTVQLVETADNEHFVLKIYHSQPNLKNIAYEQAVVKRLQKFDLSFKVPVLIPTSTGEPVLNVLDGQGEFVSVSLWTFVPGKPFETAKSDVCYSAGRALAELHKALSQLQITPIDDCEPSMQFGNLALIHPLVPNPLAAIEELPLPQQSFTKISGLVNEVAATIPGFYAKLPQQIIHGDFGASNLLVEDNCISSVLDFEFSTYDLRGIDIVTLLLWTSLPLWGSGQEWEVLTALGRGYTSLLPLDPSEITSLPDLFRLLFIVGLIHRIGRYLQGVEKLEVPLNRVEWTLKCNHWLRENSPELVRQVYNW